jgi:beta-1,2-mannobiose phosphorylase / 1,2-beta-oligomannan phosphorylase
MSICSKLNTMQVENKHIYVMMNAKEKGSLSLSVKQKGKNGFQLIHAMFQENQSIVGCCFREPFNISEYRDELFFKPEYNSKLQGIGNYRVGKIDKLEFLTYIAYEDHNKQEILAISDNLGSFAVEGSIIPDISRFEFAPFSESNDNVYKIYFLNHAICNQKTDPQIETSFWSKNMIFFLRKINNKFVFLYQIRSCFQLSIVYALLTLVKNFWLDPAKEDCLAYSLNIFIQTHLKKWQKLRMWHFLQGKPFLVKLNLLQNYWSQDRLCFH